MMCIMRRMIYKMFKDLKNGTREILSIIVVLLVLVSPVIALNLLSQYLFGDPWILVAILILAIGIMALAVITITGLIKRYKEAKEYCKKE